MERRVQITKAAFKYCNSTDCPQPSATLAFTKGAEWADKHPNTIGFAYLQSWYQDSIDEEKEPIWTDKHLEELFNDFYLIPKKSSYESK